MTRTTSLYLDLMRFISAMMVFLIHANITRLTGGLPVISSLKFVGNDAVMVFFVLSGFVIAHVAERKEVSLDDYAISRLARLYSVVVPALALTMVLDYFGSAIDPGLYDGWWFQSDAPVWRLSANLLFINELWFSSVRPFSNGPFWSLGYEFWYYVLFAAAYYLNGSRRILAVAGAMLIAGPKILMLFPVWLLGVWTYRTMKATPARPAPVPEGLGWALYLGTIVLYILYNRFDGPKLLLGWSAAHLNGLFFWTELKWSYAAAFLHCYGLGLLVAGHFIGFAGVAHRFARPLGAVAGPIRHLAGFTFAIYLFHYPLLQFLAAITGGLAEPALRNTVIVAGTFGAVYALGTVTERKKAAVKTRLAAAYARLRRRPVKVGDG